MLSVILQAEQTRCSEWIMFVMGCLFGAAALLHLHPGSMHPMPLMQAAGSAPGDAAPSSARRCPQQLPVAQVLPGARQQMLCCRQDPLLSPCLSRQLGPPRRVGGQPAAGSLAAGRPAAAPAAPGGAGSASHPRSPPRHAAGTPERPPQPAGRAPVSAVNTWKEEQRRSRQCASSSTRCTIRPSLHQTRHIDGWGLIALRMHRRQHLCEHAKPGRAQVARPRGGGQPHAEEGTALLAALQRLQARDAMHPCTG